MPRRRRSTFPVIDGVRYSVPGDRARLTADNIIELYGRDSVTINSGGEKIFAEEVEQALAHHPDVYDVTVAGRPSEKWGAEVVAIVQLRDGRGRRRRDRRSRCWPKPRSTSPVSSCPRRSSSSTTSSARRAGKADYRWAKAQAEA